MPGAQTKPASSWAKQVGLFYVQAVLIAFLGAALLYYQISQATPTDPSAIELSTARFAMHVDYQTKPPAHLENAPVVPLPHRIDDKLRGPGGFYWYELDFTVLPDSRIETVYIPRFAMNAEVYLNGERIGYYGPMTGEYAERNWNRPQIVNQIFLTSKNNQKLIMTRLIMMMMTIGQLKKMTLKKYGKN